MPTVRKNITNLVTKLKDLSFVHFDDVVSSWSGTVSNTKLPTEKLVKDSLDNKASLTDLSNGLQNIGAYTIHTVYNVNGSASAYDISSGLSYNQQRPVFFLVKNNVGDNEANATMKYYPNGNNITIRDTFSSGYSAPIQQGVWKKGTWALFYCANNVDVQLVCVFYDSVDIDEIKNNLLNILEIDDLSYYVVSSVSKDKRVTYNVDDYAIFDGNSFYLKVPYYETSTDIKVVINTSSAFIKQGSNYVTESQVNGHLLKLRYDNSVFDVVEIYDSDKLIPLFSDLSGVATSGSYNDLSDKPTIPTVPSNVSDFNNDIGYLTAHQDISGKEDKSNKVTSLSSSSTDTEYPSAKVVYDSLQEVGKNITFDATFKERTTEQVFISAYATKLVFTCNALTDNDLDKDFKVKLNLNSSLIQNTNNGVIIVLESTNLSNNFEANFLGISYEKDFLNYAWVIAEKKDGYYSCYTYQLSYGLSLLSSSIPNPSSTIPSSDTTNGSVGDGTTWARSNHTHPKSSLYAEASHTHSEYVNPTIVDNLTSTSSTSVLSAKQGKELKTLIDAKANNSHTHYVSQITDFPTIPNSFSIDDLLNVKYNKRNLISEATNGARTDDINFYSEGLTNIFLDDTRNTLRFLELEIIPDGNDPSGEFVLYFPHIEFHLSFNDSFPDEMVVGEEWTGVDDTFSIPNLGSSIIKFIMTLEGIYILTFRNNELTKYYFRDWSHYSGVYELESDFKIKDDLEIRNMDCLIHKLNFIALEK